MKVVATDGEQRYVLLVDESGGMPQARVFDAEEFFLGPVHSLDSIVARGYWQDFVGDGVEILRVAARLEST